MSIKMITEEYVSERLKKGIRDEKRGHFDYRKISIKTGTMPNAEGSADVQLGNTRVLVGVKIDIGEPMPDNPGEGTIITSAELLPMASENFEPGPPSPESVEVSRVIDRGIRAAGVVDTKSLGIDEETVWNVYLDIYVLNYDGNIFDAGSLGAVAALLTSKMPKYDDGKVIRDEKMGRLKTNGISTSCTFAKVSGAILLDPNGNEELFAASRLTVSTDENRIRAMQKGLGGYFTQNELDKAIDVSFEKFGALRSVIKESIGD